MTIEFAALKGQEETSALQNGLHLSMHYINTASQLLARRLRNTRVYSDRHAFIPLGEDCFGRSVLHQLGYKKAKLEGEPSYPFDLSITPCLSTAQLINSNFANFMNPQMLTFNGKHPAHGRYQIEFNHEQGSSFSDCSFRGLRERYAKRVNNFYKALRSSRSIVFVVHNYHSDRPIQAAHLEYLEASISDRYLDANYRIAYIETCGVECDGLRSISRHTTKISAVAPQNYIWHENSHRYSLRGLNFALRLDSIFGTYLEGIE